MTGHAPLLRILPLLGVVVVLAGCHDSLLAPDLGLEITTSRSTYVLGGEKVIVDFTVRNAGSESVWVEGCGSKVLTRLDRRDPVYWRHYTGDFCLTVYVMGPLKLEPGEEYRGARALGEAGWYRLRVGVYADGPRGEETWVAAPSAFVVER